MSEAVDSSPREWKASACGSMQSATFSSTLRIRAVLDCLLMVSPFSCAAAPLTTVQVLPSAVPEYLALVKEHRGAGDAEHVAYVSLTGTTGGLPPSKALCSSEGATSGVPFAGKFTFYNQDRAPPAAVTPASIKPPGTFVQTVFFEGKRMYRFQNGKWHYIGVFATMSDVAGGKAFGKMGTSTQTDKYGSNLSWQFTGANAFSLMGYLSKSVQMYPDGCPWQLMKITTHTGYR